VKEQGGSGKVNTDTKKKKKRVETAEEKRLRLEMMEKAKKELPFTFPAPVNHLEFRQLVEGRTKEELFIIIHRIRTCHHLGLATDNRQKMEVFLAVLIDHLAFLGSAEHVDMLAVNKLMKPIGDMAKGSPLVAAECARAKLFEYQKTFEANLASGRSPFPMAPFLLQLKLFFQIFSTSDFRNAVVTPAYLLIGRILAQGPISSARDLASGLFLCNLVLASQGESRRYFPEIVSFLGHALSLLAPGADVALLDKIALGPKSIGPDTLRVQVPKKGLAKAEIADLNFVECFRVLSPKQKLPKLFETQDFALQLLSMTLTLLNPCAELYSKYDVFPEIFRPLAAVVQAIPAAKLPQKLQTLCQTFATAVGTAAKTVEEVKAPLTLQKRKAMPIKEFNPRFDMAYFPGKRGVKDPESNNMQKLKALHKKETKGARRELKKDNQFLANQRLQDRLEKDQDYAKRIKSIYSMLDRDQQGMSVSEKIREKKKKFK